MEPFQKTRSPQDRKSFNKLRNEATAKVTEAKKTFERQLTSEIKTTQRVFGVMFRAKTNLKQGIGDLEKPDGNLAETDEDKAETFERILCFSIYERGRNLYTNL